MLRASKLVARSEPRVFFLCFLCLLCLPASAQQRPLRTADAEIVPTGMLRAQVGFDFLQDVTYPLSGLSGDQTSVGVLNLRFGVGRRVELQVEGTVRHLLSVSEQAAAVVAPSFTSPGSTHDTGDFSFWTKVRLVTESSRRPAVALRFGFEMPSSNQARGIGTNTSNLFAGAVLQKQFRDVNLFGNLGVAILESPVAPFTQNDVLTYAAAFLYPLHPRVSLAGEVFGRHSTRSITPALIGTESRSQARLGLRFRASGFQWDVAAIAGLTRRDARTGFTFGVSRDFRLFSSAPDK